MTSALWWLIGAFGLGGTLLIGVGVIFGWPIIINTKIGRIALAVGGGILGIMAIFAKGAAQGAAEARKKQEKADDDYVAKREAEDARIDSLSGDELDRMLTDGTLKPSSEGDGKGTVLQPVSTRRPNEGPKAGGG